SQVHTTVSHLSYIPLAVFFDQAGKPKQALFDRIENGTLIEIVRPNWDLHSLIGTNLDVSHLGFLLRVKGILMFRQASSVKKKVVDIPLDVYLAHYLRSDTVKGIHLEKIFIPKQ